MVTSELGGAAIRIWTDDDGLHVIVDHNRVKGCRIGPNPNGKGTLITGGTIYGTTPEDVDEW